MVDPEVIRVAERGENAAAQSLWRAAPPTLRDALRLTHRRIASGSAFAAASLDILMYNRLQGYGVGPGSAPEQLDEAVAFFREAGVRRCMAQVAPRVTPPALTDWLAARGFRPHNYWLKLVRDASPAPRAETDLAIAPVTPTHAETFGRIGAEAFGYPVALGAWLAATVGVPGWHHFGAFDGDALVAGGGVFVQDGAAWFGFANTRASHRGRGAQSAIIAARIEHARALGCRWMVSETAADTPEKPNPSTHNMRRMGFVDSYERPNWVKPLDPGAG
jgi:GNAT superfamily N-acetyltransferase